MADTATHLGVGRYALPANASALIPSGDYKSTDPTPVEIPTLGATALLIFVNMTAASGSANKVTVNVESFDPVSGTWIKLGSVDLTSAAAAFVVPVDPRIVPAATPASIQSPLPARVRIKPVGSGTRTTLTYSVGAALCL